MAQRLRLWTALAEGSDLSCKQSHRQLTRLATPASRDPVPFDLPGHCTRECSLAPVITNTSFLNNQRGQPALGLPIHTHHNNELQEIHATLGSRLGITGSAVLTSYVKHPRNSVDHHGLAVWTGYSLSEPHVSVLYQRKKWYTHTSARRCVTMSMSL